MPTPVAAEARERAHKLLLHHDIVGFFLGVLLPGGASVTQVAGGGRELRALAARLPAEMRDTADADDGPPPRASWLWVDVTGEGPRWHLAVRHADGFAADAIWFPLIGFDDQADNYADCPEIPLLQPAPAEAGAA